MGTTQSIPRSTHPVLLAVRVPGGRVIGTVRREGARVLFVRRISSKARPRILFRESDSWPLGQTALRALQAAGVTQLRYLLPEGVYEVALDAFEAQAIRRAFPSNPEVQFLLPRDRWAFTPCAKVSALAVGQTLLPLPMEAAAWAR